MTCSSREGEVHCKWNVYEDKLRLKGYISTVTLEIYLSYSPLFFRFGDYYWFFIILLWTQLYFSFLYTWNSCLQFWLLHEILYTWNTCLSLCLNYWFLHGFYWKITLFLKCLHLKSIFYNRNSSVSFLKFKSVKFIWFNFNKII